jgi:N-acetylglucosamine kinase-like BadF-type ATPase
MLDASTVQQVFEWSETAAKAEIAAFAPRVVEQADLGDGVATDIVERAVEALVKHAEALGTGGPGGVAFPTVALVGGLIEPGGILSDRIVAALATAGFRVLAGPVNPARGAVRMALAMVSRES